MAVPQAYHCICSTTILATNYNLEDLPTRRNDGLDQAKVLLLDKPDRKDKNVILENVVRDPKDIVVRLSNGFEQRTVLRCNRCHLVLGYELRRSIAELGDSDGQDVVYILPGSLATTEDMKAGRVPELPSWAKDGSS